jgi:hydroxyacylglutathione hydrolase
MAAASLKVSTFVSSAFGQNAYLVGCAATGEHFAIDPGAEAAAMADALEARGESLRAIVLTHAHMDHIEGVAELARRYPAPIYLHPDDLPLYRAAAQQAAMFGHRIEEPPPPDAELAAGQTLELGACRFEVRHVPGHSPGHVLLYSAAAGLAFVGDVVFAGSIGRTDLPGGSFDHADAVDSRAGPHAAGRDAAADGARPRDHSGAGAADEPVPGRPTPREAWMSARIAVFASGSGTNLQALMDHFAESDAGTIGLVISDRPQAQALERARQAGIRTHVIQVHSADPSPR